MEALQRQQRVMEEQARELHQQALLLRDIQTEQGRRLGDIIGSDPADVSQVQVKVGSTVYTLQAEQQQQFLQVLSDLLQDVDALWESTRRANR